MVDIHNLTSENRDLFVKLRRDLHMIPETAYLEKQTSAYVANYLGSMDLNVQTGIAQHGVLALMGTGRPGPTVMIRAEMDALPLQEETGLPFASRNEGAMHACGHDAHMAMVLGAATIIDKIKSEIQGNIKFLFQPAEEGPGGAKPMIEAGIMNDPSVDYSVGCHVRPDIPEGMIGARPGSFMAANNRFDITIKGRGGHGAMPNQCVDALEIGTQVVSALQRIVSRQIDPFEPTVVTVGSFNSGTAFNIIPAEARISGTTRTFNNSIKQSWKSRLMKVTRGVCQSMDADFALKFTKGYPPIINDDLMAKLVNRCAAKVVGEENIQIPKRSMGSEDFGFYLEKSKGCFFSIGVGRDDVMPLHNPKFDLNEDVLSLGVETFCQIVLELLG